MGSRWDVVVEVVMAVVGVDMREVEGCLEVFDQLLSVCAAVEGEDEQLKVGQPRREGGRWSARLGRTGHNQPELPASHEAAHSPQRLRASSERLPPARLGDL